MAVAEEVRSFSSSFTGTKVQILTAGARRTCRRGERSAIKIRQYLYFCSTKASPKTSYPLCLQAGRTTRDQDSVAISVLFLFIPFLFACRRGERSATKMLLRRIKQLCSNGECPLFSWLVVSCISLLALLVLFLKEMVRVLYLAAYLYYNI